MFEKSMCWKNKGTYSNIYTHWKKKDEIEEVTCTFKLQTLVWTFKLFCVGF
jgi:hypothetical protein